jgi:neutral ceramidase
MMKYKLSVLIILLQPLLAYHVLAGQATDDGSWKAGVASVVITPTVSMWMAGFADRDHPSEGKLNDLWAKALAIQDAAGKKAVLITLDLSGIPKTVSDSIRNRLSRRFNLSRSQIIINTSHTHSAPVLNYALLDLYPLDQALLEKSITYTNKLEGQIVALVGKALGSMKAADIYTENGIVRFQVNRRNNPEARLNPQTQLKGPNDYAVPVIKVADKKGKLLAVAFGYACHNTVLHDYNWSGDYAGFAQIQMEKAYPGATALFFQGCGGDQNALPRGSVAKAQQYGEELTAAVISVLNSGMKKLEPHLSTAYSEIDIEFSKPPGKEELVKMIASFSGFQKKWATIMLDKVERGVPLWSTYPYPVVFWQLGDQSLISLGGEPVVGYSIKLKEIFGQNIFVLGYSNDVMAYIPTVTVLKEGGYEGATSQMAFGNPSPWKESIEPMIIQEVKNLAGKIGIKIPEVAKQ